MKKLLGAVAFIVSVVGLVLFVLLRSDPPAERVYGVTFSGEYAREIGIDWQAAYRATLDDLKVTRLRIPAYWSVIEKERDVYDWDELDFYVREARERNAALILAIGRRVPRWPECHVPEWAQTLSWEDQKSELRDVLTAIVKRYRAEPHVEMWQVENEVFLPVFADESCGAIVDEPFLDEEVALVRALDTRPILITDSGNLGLWYKAYQRGDVFGTSMYLYFFRTDTGLFRTILPPHVYALKANILRYLFGSKPMILSELSLEPWLAASIDAVPMDEQRQRMSIEMVKEILAYARSSPYREQYLWGVEWWYFMKERGYPEYWEHMRRVFAE